MRVFVRINTAQMLRLFADLKGVPLAKVIRNAARDFAQAALKATPLAKIRSSPYARITLAGGGTRYARLDRYGGSTLRNLRKKKYRIRINRGWSRASWIGVFRALGMEKAPHAPARLPAAVETIGRADMDGDDTSPRVRILDEIRFDGLPGTEDAIIDAGLGLAAKRIDSEWNRIMKGICR